MTGFLTPLDIQNRACQHVGARRIGSTSENTRQNAETTFAYDKLRLAELRRSVWRFATRRVMMRPITTTGLILYPAAYSALTAYTPGKIVVDTNGVYWINIVAATGVTPGTVTTGKQSRWQQYFGPVYADTWSNTVTYNAGDLVFKSGPVFYISSTNANLNNDPASGSPWIACGGTSDGTLFLPEPVGPAMTVNNTTRNAFLLPNGFLRVAPEDPKIASASTLLTSAGLQYNDMRFEGNVVVRESSDPFLMRFVADVSDVPSMDALFCEGLSARIAYEVCETLTQSNVKLQAIGAAYQKFIRDARLINWLETASTEPQEDDYELTKGPQGVQDQGSGGSQNANQ